VGQTETVNQISYNNYNNTGRDLYVILQSIATSLVMQLIIEIHTAHDYTQYV